MGECSINVNVNQFCPEHLQIPLLTRKTKLPYVSPNGIKNKVTSSDPWG